MENVIRKLYGMYMDNDNGEENEMSEIHDDLCKAKKEAALLWGTALLQKLMVLPWVTGLM